jgi:hypothetical protein
MIDWIIYIPLIVIVYIVVKYCRDMSKNFAEYLSPELSKHDFTLVSSKYYLPKFMDYPFNDLDEDININPLGGRFAIAPIHVYRHLRKVVFQKKDGSKHEVIAGIEFKGFSSKKFKRVRWKPALSSFINNDQTTT